MRDELAGNADNECIGSTVEARASVRYRLSTPAVFSWDGHAGGRFLGEGDTRDISKGGAYILTPTCPPTGIMIQLKIFLTPPDPAGRSLRITTEGRVLRVEYPADSMARGGFAIESKGFQIVLAERGEN
jgi:PilZ domain-containing protein